MPNSEGPAKTHVAEFGNDSFPQSQSEAEKYWENVSFTADLPSRPKHQSRRHGNQRTSRSTSRSLTPKATPDDPSLRSFRSPVVKLPPQARSMPQDDSFSITELFRDRDIRANNPLSGAEPTRLQNQLAHLPQQSQLPQSQQSRMTLNHSESENFLKLHQNGSIEQAAESPSNIASRPSASPLLRHSSAPPPPIPYASKPLIQNHGSTPEVPRSVVAFPEPNPETPSPGLSTSTFGTPLTPTRAAKGETLSPGAQSDEVSFLDGISTAKSPCSNLSDGSVSKMWSRKGIPKEMTHSFVRLGEIWSVLGLRLTKIEWDPGHVYAFRVLDPTFEGFIKIGFATNLRKRMDDHAGCYGAYEMLYNENKDHPREISHARRVERLIHTELAPWHYKLHECPNVAKKKKGHKTHGEWFKLDPESAVPVIEKWSNFIRAKPYDGDVPESVTQNEGNLSKGPDSENRTAGQTVQQDTPSGQSQRSKPPSKQDSQIKDRRLNPSFKFDEMMKIQIPAVLVPVDDILNIKTAHQHLS
ncbi:MAG: hypothetical protein Q9160_005937 [Pyrenula sp. 1 TL-2023]